MSSFCLPEQNTFIIFIFQSVLIHFHMTKPGMQKYLRQDMTRYKTKKKQAYEKSSSCNHFSYGNQLIKTKTDKALPLWSTHNNNNRNFYSALPINIFTAQGMHKSDTNNNNITHVYTYIHSETKCESLRQHTDILCQSVQSFPHRLWYEVSFPASGLVSSCPFLQWSQLETECVNILIFKNAGKLLIKCHIQCKTHPK